MIFSIVHHLQQKAIRWISGLHRGFSPHRRV